MQAPRLPGLMARTHVSDLTAALGEARREATSAPTRLRRLAEVSSAVGSLSRTAAGEAACRTLVELLGLDAAWVLEGSPVDMQVLARWARSGAAAGRLGAQRLRVLADAAVDEVSQARDGRYVLVVVRLPDGPGHSLFVIGSARSGRLLSADDLACARLVAAAHARQLQRPALQQPTSAGVARPAGERMVAFQELAGALAGLRSEVEVAQEMVDGISKLVGGSSRFYLTAPSGRDLTVVARSDATSRELGGSDDSSAVEHLAGRAIAERISRRIANARLESDAAGEAGETLDESMLVAPLLAAGEPMGVIVVSKSGPDRFADDDLHLLEAAAATAAVVCASARLQERAREQAEVAQALLELGAVLALQGDANQVAVMVTTAIDRLVGSAALSVWLREGDRLRMAGHAGHTPAEIERLRDQPLDALAAPFDQALQRRTVTVLELAGCGQLADRLAGSPPGSLVALVAIGERAGNRGLVVVQRGPRRGPPSYRDEQMLLGIADQALLALTNRRLYRELEDSFLATVKALANALEAKDEYTGDHAQALVGLSTDVAHRLGVSGAQLRDISLAAALHDVGKIGIPAEILNKPGPLTADEWSVMKLHPELGARIIEPVPALAGARELVLACHEHWDGSGYPLGLAGDGIPLGARVILACDAFHAMISNRVYRSALDMPDALAELERCAGSHFDPDVAYALIDTLRTEAGSRGLTAA